MSQQKKEKKKINYSPDKKYKEGSSKKSPNKKSPSNQTRTSIGDFLNLNLANIPQVKEDQKRKNLNASAKRKKKEGEQNVKEKKNTEDLSKEKKKDIAEITKELYDNPERKKKLDQFETVEDKNEVISPITNQVAAFEKFAKVVFAMGIDGLMKEYNEGLKPYVSSPYDRDVFDRHKSKNRYKDVVCNGYTRVILNDGRGSDYIHANYIRGDRLVCSFICTQGPLPSTVFDFWRMIWMEKVCHIIMLCGVSEEGKRKCEQYWPDSKGTQVICQDFVITTIKISNTDMHVTRTTLEIKQGSEKHYLKHHRWKTWPDKTVPKSLLAVFRILHQVRQSKTPVVVHCSAGIGRTGSFVAIEMALQRLLAGDELNLLETCRRLRDQRMHSVQVEIQYIYVAEALCEYGRAMKYITDPNLLKEFERFKEAFNAYVASLGVEEAPAPLCPLPTPAAATGFTQYITRD
ncbi:hypothetical protein Q1695_016095 [Nippostrongylus brasiliensis]|nr:hypothetical protein Q1695_016095 [Nippostrongylus brasiliensis]